MPSSFLIASVTDCSKAGVRFQIIGRQPHVGDPLVPRPARTPVGDQKVGFGGVESIAVSLELLEAVSADGLCGSLRGDHLHLEREALSATVGQRPGDGEIDPSPAQRILTGDRPASVDDTVQERRQHEVHCGLPVSLCLRPHVEVLPHPLLKVAEQTRQVEPAVVLDISQRWALLRQLCGLGDQASSRGTTSA